MSVTNWWKQRRAEREAQAYKTITGVDPRASGVGMEEQSVRMKVATMVRELFDGGADPIVLIQSYLVGAVWLADNCGVSREQLVQLVTSVELKRDRALIFKPGDR